MDNSTFTRQKRFDQVAALIALVGMVFTGSILKRVMYHAEITVQNTYAKAAIEAKQSLPDIFLRRVSTRVLFVGDIMLGRTVETLMRKEGDDYPFKNIKNFFKSQDIIIGNLEGPIPDKHMQTPIDSLVMNFKKETPALLKKQGFSVLTFANNHAYDAGEKGFTATKRKLSSVGIRVVGNPHGSTGCCSIVQESMVPLAICAYLAFGNLNQRDVLDEVRTFHTKHTNAYLVVTPHWGNEYQQTASAFQKSLGHAFIDVGASAVVGHHPHVVQNIELYRGRPIIYSLGNFIFDQYFSAETQQELAVELAVNEREVSVRLVPIKSVKSQPTPMGQEAAQSFLAGIAARSSTAKHAIQNGFLLLAK